MASKEQPLTSPASDEPVYEIDSFELLWEQHKSKIIAGVVALVVVVTAVFGWLITSNAQRAAAEKAFSHAKSAAEYRAVIDKYASFPVAGDASLLLAKSLRDEKKYDEANQVLDQFLTAQPEHPFIPLAKIAVAENLALSGKFDDAKKALEMIAQTNAQSFAAPSALYLAAELQSAQGQREDALKTYRRLLTTFPESEAARVSAPVSEVLEAMFPPAKTPVQ